MDADLRAALAVLAGIVLESKLPYPMPASKDMLPPEQCLGLDALMGLQEILGVLHVEREPLMPFPYFYAYFGDQDEGKHTGGGRSPLEAFKDLLEWHV